MLNVHTYDSWISENKKQILEKIKTDNLNIDNIWNEIFELSRKYNPNVQEGVRRIYERNDYDINIQHYSRPIGAYVFSKIKDYPDLVSLFFIQFEDMLVTNGFCPQGQTNRYLQILFCLE